MRRNRQIPVLAAGLMIALLAACWSATPAAGEQAGQPSAGALSYKPPKRGAPKVRVASASRGEGEELPSLFVLAPDHVGLTVQLRPRLFWYQSAATELPMVFSLAEDDAIEPLLEFKLTHCALEGLVEVNLGDFGVALTPEVEYRWVVAIVPDPHRRSRDVLAEGRIMRIERSQELVVGLEGKNAGHQATLYAQHSIWYDALAALEDQMRAEPHEPQWRRRRSELLREVDLPEPAAALERADTAKVAQAARAAERVPTAPVYAPARRGAPSRLVSSATRTGEEDFPLPDQPEQASGRDRSVPRTTEAGSGVVLSVLMPKDGGSTICERPALFWYLSKTADVPISLSVAPREGEGPSCEVTTRESDRGGIQRLDLGRFGLSLECGRAYDWRVALIRDGLDRSQDVTVGAVLTREEPASQLAAGLKECPPGGRPAVLARHGMWCDALGELSDLIEAAPDDTELRKRRAGMLRRMGLAEAAAWDLK